MAIRQDVHIFWKPGNFMAEMQGCHALKQFVRKGGMSFSRISHTCLSGSVMCYEIKKYCRINFQCRRKNVIMVVNGKSDRGPCPAGSVACFCLPVEQCHWLRDARPRQQSGDVVAQW